MITCQPDGLSGSLITALAQISAFKVIGKSSSFLFRDSKESSHQIGEQLNVARLLVGSVERFGGQISGVGRAHRHLGRHHGLVAAVRPRARPCAHDEPLKANWYNWLALYLVGANRLDEAEQASRKAIELQPTATGFHEELAVILILRGETSAALESAQQERPGVWQDLASPSQDRSAPTAAPPMRH